MSKAIGYIVGQPFQQRPLRSGLAGIVDRITLWWDRNSEPRNECSNCGKPTPGYSWCSVQCIEQPEQLM